MSEETKNTPSPVVIPEGDPNKDWTKKELVAYGKREYPDLKLMMAWKEDTILSKLAEAKVAASVEITKGAKSSSAPPAATPGASDQGGTSGSEDKTSKGSKTSEIKPEDNSQGAKAGSGSSKDSKSKAEKEMQKVYKAYFDANEDVDELHFTQEMDGRTMGYLKPYDAQKRQRQVNPKGKVQTVNRKSIK